ncbi:COX15/CtaA family protein [Alicyclobacillus tolerans]|uniref:COX15/CtaA family protein n=1 Tax=Alicyclobacillus tolerans TaxID=90970 RepID=UPI001F0098E7|nr:COX15/CtaA family protein [Alicyclobacillus tolerans]MCF8565458.1 COX15/CtaA family protein [Alicyclobacillus tolerans]
MVKFHRLAWFTTIVIGVQMVLAGIIVGKDAGFVCPSWPFCGRSGSFQMTGSLIFELTHRFVALLLGVLVIWLFAWLLISYRHHRAMVWTCSLGLLSLLIQIIYAGMIVLFVFPGIATTVDVLNSMIMLSLFVHLANLAQREYQVNRGNGPVESDIESRALHPSAWTLYAAGMLTVAAGAVFRHTGASQALFGQDSYILSHGQTVPPSQVVSHALLNIHMATAVLLMIAGVWFARVAFQTKRLTKTAIVVLSLIVVQAILGVASLATKLALVVVTFHWGVAGLILGVIALALSRTYVGVPPTKRRFRPVNGNVA